MQTGPGLRLAAIPGATPDKWADRWRRRYPELDLAVDYYDDAGQLARVRRGTADLGYVRVLAEEAVPAGREASESGRRSERGSGGEFDGELFSGAGRSGSEQPAPQGTAPQQAEALAARELAEALAAGELHRLVLYREEPVVCAARDHWVAAAEESVDWEEIAEEPFLRPEEMRQNWGEETDGASTISLDEAERERQSRGPAPIPSRVSAEESPAEPSSAASADATVHTPRTGAELAHAERQALEVVASGAGLLILPQSVACMLSRKDVVVRRVEGIPGYDVALAWRRDHDDAVIQEFIGVARGRKPGSGRSELPQKPEKVKAAPKRVPRTHRGRTRPSRTRRRPR